tara:strand:- start:1605 stop:2915 length:1311 start_codon:yes stop_codon:yes gene_type:complete
MAQEPNTDEEMNDMLLEEQVDPVSGNTAPVGALPSEVRDDIDIRVSENEYVIPAYAVRYFGEGFFDELLGAAEQGWDRIKEGDELPFRDDELETEGDDEEPKEGYAEGGNIPGAGMTVPQPVGGGFGGYGGTGARFSGFESRIYINPETGREMLIFFFNGKPMKRIPQGFRPKGETAVQEQQTVAAESQRDDDDRDRREQQDPTYLNTPVDKWTDDMYAAYSKAEPMGLIEKGFVSLVGNLIAGPAGALGLNKLAEHAEKKQAEAVQTSLGTKMKAGNITQDQYDIYSSAVKAASDRMFGYLGDGESGSKTGLGLHFSSQQAMRDYYEGSSAASDAGIITGFDDPSFVGGGAGWVNPDTGQVGSSSSSNADGPSAAQIASQNASNTAAATESTAEPKTSDGGQDNNPNAPDNDPEDDGGYDFGSAYNYNKGGLIKK